MRYDAIRKIRLPLVKGDPRARLTLPALKIQQFAKEFYLLNLAAGDLDRLLRFEVLGQAGVEGKKARKPKSSGVNWGELEGGGQSRLFMGTASYRGFRR